MIALLVLLCIIGYLFVGSVVTYVVCRDPNLDPVLGIVAGLFWPLTLLVAPLFIAAWFADR